MATSSELSKVGMGSTDLALEEILEKRHQRSEISEEEASNLTPTSSDALQASTKMLSRKEVQGYRTLFTR